MEESAAGSQPPKLVDVPYDFQDPISHELMWDPVLLVESGHTYNRVSIQQWFQRGNRTCPKTNRKLKSLLVATNWTLRSLIESWAQKNGIPVPAPPQQPKLLCASQPSDALTSSGLQSHPILLGSSSTIASTSGEEHTGVIPESWTFFQGYDSVGGDLFRLQFDFASPVSPLMQLLEAADKVPNCIAFNSSGHLKAALKSRDSWVLCEEEPAGGLHVAGPRHEQVGLYVRTQCLPFIEAGCSSWAADAAAAPPTDSSGWTFFPGMDSPGGDICQAITQAHQEGAGAPPALTSVDGSITSSSAIALLALAKPIVVAFNSNGWLKTLLQPMHGWVKWTTEAGKGLFVRNDVLMALLSGVLAHVQGNQLAPVQLAGWTFIQGLDSLGGDVHWSWQNANEPVKLAEEACLIDGVIAFNTNGYIKTALRPRSHWTKVEVWADKPSSGIYVHNSVLWKLLIA